MRLLLLFTSCLCLAEVAGPRIGFVCDRAGNLLPVYGVAGAFVLGDPIEIEVLSAAFSGKAGMAKKERTLILYRNGEPVQSLDAPPGLALFGFDKNGEPDWVRFANDTCLVWRDGAPEPGACPAPEPAPVLNLSEAVESITPMADQWLAVRTASGLWAVRDEHAWQLPEPVQ